MKKDFAKKLGAYTLAAAAAGAVASKANAAMMVYDNGGAGWFDAVPEFTTGPESQILLMLDGTVLTDAANIDAAKPGLTDPYIEFLHDGYWYWGDGKDRDSTVIETTVGSGFVSDGADPVKLGGTEVIDGSRTDFVGEGSQGGLYGYGWYQVVGGFGGRGIMGLYLDDVDGRHYGWADLSVNGSRNEVTLYSFAFSDTAGRGVYAGGGEVPEPVTMGLLALGATGLLARRKRA